MLTPPILLIDGTSLEDTSMLIKVSSYPRETNPGAMQGCPLEIGLSKPDSTLPINVYTPRTEADKTRHD